MPEELKSNEYMNMKPCGQPDSNESCPAVGYQKVSVCVPVTVMPFAHAGAVRTKCCGAPVITTGDGNCEGKKNGVTTFTLSQTICIEVPIDFGATTAIGDTYVNSLGVSSYDICSDCDCECDCENEFNL